MKIEARRWRFRETGGALLGWRSGRDAVVARVLGPGPKAKHSLSYFEPDADWQVEQGRRIYADSGRTVAYLGDWHTHPGGGISPSVQDKKAARLIAKDDGFRAPEPLSAVMPRSRTRPSAESRLAVYLWADGKFEPMEMLATDLSADAVRYPR